MLTSYTVSSSCPLVSSILPARNEAKRFPLPPTLRSRKIDQDYTILISNLAIIIVPVDMDIPVISVQQTIRKFHSENHWFLVPPFCYNSNHVNFNTSTKIILVLSSNELFGIMRCYILIGIKCINPHSKITGSLSVWKWIIQRNRSNRCTGTKNLFREALEASDPWADALRIWTRKFENPIFLHLFKQ